jgi:hypothetical protein
MEPTSDALGVSVTMDSPLDFDDHGSHYSL